MAGMKKKLRHRGQKGLTPNQIGHTIQDVREVVIARMRTKGMTAYGLAKAAKAAGGKMTEQTVRNFLRGVDVRSSSLMALLTVLDLEIRPKR
jgi:hypothetical protein